MSKQTDELTAALTQAADARRHIATQALREAARGRLADPDDVTAFVDVDSIDVATDGTVNPRQVQLAVDAVRQRYSGLIWRPRAHPDQMQREPSRGLVAAPKVPRPAPAPATDPSAGLNVDYVTRNPHRFSEEVVRAAKDRLRARDPDVHAKVDGHLERLRREGRLGGDPQ